MKKSRKASRLKQLYAESAREYRMRAILQFMTDVPEPMLSSDLMFGFRKAFPELKASHQCLMRDLRVLQERGAVCSVLGKTCDACPGRRGRRSLSNEEMPKMPKLPRESWSEILSRL